MTHTTASHLLPGVLQAANFAAGRHAHQRRKGANSEPYVNHLLEVAGLLTTAIGDSDPHLIMAGLLHDTVEDTGLTRAELAAVFGEDVASLVMEVTDDKSLPKATRKALQIENAPHKTVRAKRLKLADKISNLRSMIASPPSDWDLERRQQYVEWAKRVVDACGPDVDPFLQAEFAKTYNLFEAQFGLAGSVQS